ncbi:MAG: peptidoglycan DD-metalloendopeptidase family protein [Cryomorphaceae bacterium]|nr:peptidoglycan DD-metalloendopeptidase family protein [Cryomorphaceae bacterium]
MLRSNIALFLFSFLSVSFAHVSAQNTGGDFDESMLTRVEVVNESSSVNLWDVNDSLYNIPAYDVYCHWDTRNIHAYEFNPKELTDTTTIILRKEFCDYATPFTGNITSYYGERGNKPHFGIDVKLTTGDPVKSAFEGLVRISQYSSSYGNVVVVRHPNGLETLYAHLSARKVKPGDYVQAGDLVGLGGNTGRSTGSHLHFECRYKGEPIDPATIIDFENGVLKKNKLDLTQSSFEYVVSAKSAKYHTVKKGETLSGISRKYGTSVRSLSRLNGIGNSGTIYAGKKIRVR